MPRSALAERLGAVTTTDPRGKLVERRMQDLGMGPTELAKEASVSRALVYRVIGDRDGVSENSYQRIEKALDRLEAEFGPGGPDAMLSTEQGLVEFEVTGDFGVRVVVKGPVSDANELEAAVARLVRDIRDRPPVEE